MLLVHAALLSAVNAAEPPVVELSLMHSQSSPVDEALQTFTQRHEQQESEFVAQLHSVYDQELAKAKPLMQQIIRDMSKKYHQYLSKSSKAFLQDSSRPDSMLITLADSKPIPNDIRELIVQNERELNAQESELLESSFAEVRRSVDDVVNRISRHMFIEHKPKAFISQNEQGMPFDVQVQRPKNSYMKVADGVAKLSLLRANAIEKMQARVQTVLHKLFQHTRNSVFLESRQPHISAGSPIDSGRDLSGLVNEVLQGANSVVSVGVRPAENVANKEVLDKASDDLKSVTNGALAMQSSGNRGFFSKQFLSTKLMPVPVGNEVKNRLFDTEPMQRPSVASLNVYVEEDTSANLNAAKLYALKSQIRDMDSNLQQA